MASASSPETGATFEDLENPKKSEENSSRQNQRLQFEEFADRGPLGSDDVAKAQRSKWRFGKKYRHDQRTEWWFASTAIPLFAATIGPLANVTSIAALVSYWRETILIDGKVVADFNGVTFADPAWCYWSNVGSLICGFLGNLFLLLNFTQRIRYIIALPATIILWYISTALLIGITVCMEVYDPPIRPSQIYTQGYWYAIASAAFYLICSMILMVNMLGYFLGHYPETFALDDSQRTVILQTMLFFIWLAGGAAVFSRVESLSGEPGWDFSDALYFCDVTILTVGFGDLYPTTNLARGLVFPYSVGGIIILSLVISSIYHFVRQLGDENIVQKRANRMRERTLELTVGSSFDLAQREHADHDLIHKRSIRDKKISAPFAGHELSSGLAGPQSNADMQANIDLPNASRHQLSAYPPLARITHRKPRFILMREEKDRFEAMRRIQRSSREFKKWSALISSIVAYLFLWCVGALVFWRLEKDAQGLSYFEALYFCYISLLTIGYGDMSPRSNAGRTFFVIWSLIAIPTMALLVSGMGDTVVEKFKRLSDNLADFTVLPKEGIWRMLLEKKPWLLRWLTTRKEKRAAKKRIRRGFQVMDPEEEGAGLEPSESAPNDGVVAVNTDDDDDNGNAPRHVDGLPSQAEVHHSPAALATALALSIHHLASDLQRSPPKKYTYEEWVEFTRLLRQSSKTTAQAKESEQQQRHEEDDEGLVDWDWIGHNSPLVSGLSEAQWLLNRMCDALVRVEKRRNSKDISTRLDGRRVAVDGEDRGEEGRSGE